MILFFILLTIVIVCGKYIHELHNINPTANLVNLQNPDSLNIQKLMKDKSPIIIHNLLGKHENLLSVSLSNLIEKNPGYIINDNKDYKKKIFVSNQYFAYVLSLIFYKYLYIL